MANRGGATGAVLRWCTKGNDLDNESLINQADSIARHSKTLEDFKDSIYSLLADRSELRQKTLQSADYQEVWNALRDEEDYSPVPIDSKEVKEFMRQGYKRPQAERLARFVKEDK